MAVTIRDVALAAGVSPMAVSKALHGKGSNVRVSPETAELIRKTAKELRYTPNSVARHLRRGKTRTIGLIFEQFGRLASGSQYFVHLLDGVTAAAFEAGYSLTICPKVIRGDVWGTLGDGRFDGVIWAKFSSEPNTVQELEHTRMPVVMLHAPAPAERSKKVNYVCCDNRQALGLAVRHLALLGHRRIGFVYDLANAYSDEFRDRRDGFFAACAEEEIRCSEADCIGLTIEGDGFEEWWRGSPDQTALILMTETLAGPIYARAAKLSISIPERLSIVGFDSTQYCDMLLPRLTAISQPIQQMAERATEVLIDWIEGRCGAAQCLVYPCGLDIRDSTVRPAFNAEVNL